MAERSGKRPLPALGSPGPCPGHLVRGGQSSGDRVLARSQGLGLVPNLWASVSLAPHRDWVTRKPCPAASTGLGVQGDCLLKLWRQDRNSPALRRAGQPEAPSMIEQLSETPSATPSPLACAGDDGSAFGAKPVLLKAGACTQALGQEEAAPALASPVLSPQRAGGVMARGPASCWPVGLAHWRESQPKAT